MTALQAVDPNEVLTFSNNWDDWLPSGDTINSRSWGITPAGPQLQNTDQAVVTVSNFVAGQDYQLTETVTTAGGLTGRRSFVLRCERL